MSDVPGLESWEGIATPGHHFARIARLLARIGDSRMRAFGIVTAHLPVLTALWNCERLSATELAKRAQVEQSSMAETLARMHRDGLVRRDPDPKDRRSTLISLTDAARDKLPLVARVLKGANEEATAGIALADLELVLEILERLTVNLVAMDRQN
jgi:MarR family transcriptional regulator for hemolysin